MIRFPAAWVALLAAEPAPRATPAPEDLDPNERLRRLFEGDPASPDPRPDLLERDDLPPILPAPAPPNRAQRRAAARTEEPMTRAKSRRRRAMARERAALPSPTHPELATVDPVALAAETWLPIPAPSTQENR